MMVSHREGIEPDTRVKLSMRDVAGITVMLAGVMASVIAVYMNIDRRASRIEWQIEAMSQAVIEGKQDRKDIHKDLDHVGRQVDKIVQHINREQKQVEIGIPEAKAPQKETP